MKYLKLMRIKHYLKNILILFPLFFSGNIFELSLLFSSFWGFIAFSLVASMIYIINDIRDVEDDRKHEIKKKRPLASGQISIKNAKKLLVFLMLLAILINFLFIDNKLSFLYLILYFAINLGYSFGLKEKPIIDIFLLSLGFLIRVLYGGCIVNVEISNWLYLTVLSASFYMSMGKRRNEIKKNGNKSRKVLKYYNVEFLDKNMYMFLTMSLIFFSLWCFDFKNQYMIFLIPLVFVACLRYSFNIEKEDSFGDPIDVLTGDKFLLALGLILGIGIMLLLYVFPIGD